MAVCQILLGIPGIASLTCPGCDDGVVTAAVFVGSPAGVPGGFVLGVSVEEDSSVGTTGGGCEINDGGS